ncbi:MAG: MgtC/SapB family protein [Candidatus Gastranaerophilales bacterium]|nr:MgtC/SapB family protein [Candidatus Gastranaerophilales bacterium]
MDLFNFDFSSIPAYYTDMALRVTLALVLGFAIGIEREITSKFAGLRTHILVCLGSCVFTILSIYAFPTISAGGNPVAYGDPARIAAQILTGIGFIGGGTVLRHGPSVFGLTTAATLWTTASIGMAAGAGSISLAVFATILTLMVLILIRNLEVTFLRGLSQKTANIKATLVVDSANLNEVITKLGKKFRKIVELNHTKSDREQGKEKIYFVTKVVSKDPILDMYSEISKIEHVENVYITNLNFEP